MVLGLQKFFCLKEGHHQVEAAPSFMKCPTPDCLELLIYPGHVPSTCGFCGVICGYSLTVGEL